MKLKDGFDSNYRYILVAARRARQLSGGAPTLVNTSSRKVCKIAQEELDAGKVPYVVVEKAPAAEAPTSPLTKPE
ncbi:MAG: DNA-directed RNA polymerase subunit omega [Candidatus Angelobacter sp.]|jgi:DNA-directed RNA polymerase subunit omega